MEKKVLKLKIKGDHFVSLNPFGVDLDLCCILAPLSILSVIISHCRGPTSAVFSGQALMECTIDLQSVCQSNVSYRSELSGILCVSLFHKI